MGFTLTDEYHEISAVIDEINNRYSKIAKEDGLEKELNQIINEIRTEGLVLAELLDEVKTTAISLTSKLMERLYDKYMDISREYGVGEELAYYREHEDISERYGYRHPSADFYSIEVGKLYASEYIDNYLGTEHTPDDYFNGLMRIAKGMGYYQHVRPEYIKEMKNSFDRRIAYHTK